MFSHVFTCFTLLHQVLFMPLLGRKSKCGTVTYHLMPTAFCWIQPPSFAIGKSTIVCGAAFISCVIPLCCHYWSNCLQTIAFAHSTSRTRRTACWQIGTICWLVYPPVWYPMGNICTTSWPSCGCVGVCSEAKCPKMRLLCDPTVPAVRDCTQQM